MDEVVKYLLAGGIGVFLTAIGASVKWVYNGISRREDKVETQTRNWQRDTVTRATWEAKQHDYWRDYAGRLEYIITSHPALGPDKLPEKRPYPRRPRTPDEEDSDTKAVER